MSVPRAAAARADPPLARYRAKRDFKATPEPADVVAPSREERLGFVIQKHWASRLHYDFRLELDGVLLSWAVPKGPSFDPSEKRMAIHVEDHPVSYGGFEGSIPKGQYGAGTVIVWDRGTWEPVGDPRKGLADGKLVFHLHGDKLAGLWELVRIAKPGDRQEAWILFKKKDDWARPHAEYDVVSALPDSVVTQPLGPVEQREPRGRAAAAGVDAQATEPETPDLSAARRSALPRTLEPQLATLASAPPTAGRWQVETKFDGYRLLARIQSGRVALITRNGNDWTSKLEPLAEALRALDFEDAWLDGEIVVLNEKGLPDFNALQNAMDSARSGRIVYFVFDLPFHDGRDLRAVPLASRRALLRQLLARHDSEKVRFSETFEVPPAQMLQAACAMGLEGILLKRADAPYVSSRSETWLKLKCQRRQEFVVVGFTDRNGAPTEAGSLLLAYHENGALRFAGSVGTGWDAATGRELHRKLSRLQTEQPPVDPKQARPGRWSRRTAGSEHWVKPKMVVEVGFSEWTPDGHVRHPTFKGVRTDKPAAEITRERSTGAAASTRPAGVKVTNPDRVIDPSTGLKKLDLVRYYESVAEWMLPHLKDRPVSLVRGPQGVTGQLFFQKHPETRMPGLTELDPALWPGHEALLSVDSTEALVAAAQMNVIEFHTWNSTVQRIDEPDRMVFDLDPGEGVTWKQVQEAAVLVRTLLQELGLQAWLKTSGGKGLHLVVPLAPKFDYEVVKGFSQAVVQHIAQTIPQRFVAKSGGANRVQRIFIDYLRNGHGQTTAAAFSARSRPGLGVSMTVAWEQLMELKGGAQWTIATAREFLSFRSSDPWAGYWKARQPLAAAMKALGFTPSPSRKPKV